MYSTSPGIQSQGRIPLCILLCKTPCPKLGCLPCKTIQQVSGHLARVSLPIALEMLIEATKCIWPGRMALQPGLTSKDHSKHTKRSLVLHPICSCGLPGDRQIKGLPGSLNWAEPLDLSMSLHLLHQHSQNQLWAKVALRSQWAEEGDLQGGNAP